MTTPEIKSFTPGSAPLSDSRIKPGDKYPTFNEVQQKMEQRAADDGVTPNKQLGLNTSASIYTVNNDEVARYTSHRNDMTSVFPYMPASYADNSGALYTDLQDGKFTTMSYGYNFKGDDGKFTGDHTSGIFAYDENGDGIVQEGEIHYPSSGFYMKEF